jgi:hypothetical protein
MKVSGKVDAPATLLPEKKPPVANEQQGGWVQDLFWILVRKRKCHTSPWSQTTIPQASSLSLFTTPATVSWYHIKMFFISFPPTTNQMAFFFMESMEWLMILVFYLHTLT